MTAYYALLTAILWGITYASTEQLVKHINVTTYLAISCVLSAVIYGIAARNVLIPDILSPQMVTALPWVVISCVGSCVACVMSILAVQHSGATTAAIIEISYPLWVCIFASLFSGRNQLTYSTFFGAILIMCGILVVMKWK